MASSVLPDSRSSLTKYIWLEDHYKLLKHIKNDTTVHKLKERFAENVVATACKRYLAVDGARVRRDKLIDLVHEEGAFTTRVKMVMYFVFLFRDPRYRAFICEKVATKDGRWDATGLKAETGSFFDGSGGTKAFTNLRQLLVQAALLQDLTFRIKQFPDLSLWFPDAVETSASYILNPVAKQEFLGSPQSFLVKHGLNGLLNATPAELNKVKVYITYEDSADQLPIYPPKTYESPGSAGFKPWNKSSPPKRSDLLPAETLTNPALLERANNQHFLLEKMVSEGCTTNGHRPQYNIHIDLFVDTDAGTVLFEMKSCNVGSVRLQVRRAISQVFEYSYRYRDSLKSTVQRCIVVERKPRGPDNWLVQYVQFLGIALVWKKDSVSSLECSAQSLRMLVPFLGNVGAWISADSK
jgi:hypothetical protein